MTLREFVRHPLLRWSYALAFALAGCAATSGCGVKMNANDPPFVQPRQRGTCSEMCSTFSRFGCDAALPSPRLGVTCEARCEHALSTGAITPPIDCVSSAKSVEEIETRCSERCH